MVRSSKKKPIGQWELIQKDDGISVYCWTCPFCGKEEQIRFYQNISQPVAYNECWHCGKDATGKSELILCRNGTMDIWGDGDFNWDGSWRGTKKILIHRPFNFHNQNESRTPYDRPDIVLKVHAVCRGRNHKTQKYYDQVACYSARLSLLYGRKYIEVVTSKKVSSLKQLRKEVEELDLSAAIKELLKCYYDRSGARAVWKRENDRWVPYMTSYGEINGLELPDGLYAVWSPRYNKYSMIHRSVWSASSYPYNPKDGIELPPPPWTEDASYQATSNKMLGSAYQIL